MKKDLFNRKNSLLVIIIFVGVCSLGALGAGVAYLSGIGTKSQLQTAQGHLKATVSSSSRQSSKSKVKTSKTQASEKKASKKKVESSSSFSSSFKQTEQAKELKQKNLTASTTAQVNSVITPLTYSAVYNGFTGYSTVSYDEALAIAKSLAENEMTTTESAQKVTQQSTQQNAQESVQQQELEKTIESIQAQDPNTQINIIRQ
ncbi:hypothetical protein P7H71_09460 [Lactococcus lactis]|uniref:Uncharacterized protein n=2 Tax=Lactococcus lactis subsp. lactis TaxID=1360 RepID=S6F7G1_LACLL|nr:hypothetical protein [Lactococcus lactis]MDN6242475.1 hypothetical protein [Tetragenococcus koreensis]ARE21589.1 hypothetical protein LLUC06_2047 [Lactococcus lactis subsp. lactis]MDH8062625.1 hypothetical protein [Lactococcus lactis subsp. lactis]MDN5424654.1 hypothetical protein [Lactococcus lactis]MDN5615578.1 hypothetical protein [Lactococcus lactis]